MSFLSSAWDSLTGETLRNQQQLTPEQEKAIKVGNYNEKLWGSRTIEKKWNEYGQGEYFSSLTGNTYPSPEAARADEAAYTANPAQWASNRKMAPAIGEQPAVEVGTQVNDMGLDVSDPYDGAMSRFDKNIVNPALEPKKAATAPTPGTNVRPPGFTTDEILVTGGRPRRGVPSPVTAADGRNALTIDPAGLPGGPPMPQPAGPGDPAPDINRDKIDDILNGLSGYEHDMYAMGQDNTGLSVAEAQLEKSYELAKIRARDELATNQAGALGMARSARSRSDRGLLERQAIGEQAYLGSQKQRNDVLQQAEFEGNQAILRATEEDADRRFRLEAIDRASRLGLNTAALETDIAKADLDSATNWINQEFARLHDDKIINLEEGKALLGFSRDMAAIQQQYDKLSVDDQNVADQLMMQKYGIDQGTMLALKKIKEDGKFKWDEFFSKLIGGAVGGLTGGLGGAIGGAGGGDEGTSPSDW